MTVLCGLGPDRCILRILVRLQAKVYVLDAIFFEPLAVVDADTDLGVPPSICRPST